MMNTNWWVQDNNPINDYVCGAVSPPTVARAPPDGISNSATATISSTSPFALLSPEPTSARDDHEQLQVTGYLNGQIVGTKTVTLNPWISQVVNFNFQQIDIVRLFASGCTIDPAFALPNVPTGPTPQFVIGNVTMGGPGTSPPPRPTPAPEPSSLACWGYWRPAGGPAADVPEGGTIATGRRPLGAIRG